jgi:hypothetical protein
MRFDRRDLSQIPFRELVLWATLASVPAPAFAQQTSTSTSAPSAQPQPTSAKAPMPNRLNDVLPEWLHVRGEFRERFEGFDGLGFAPGRDDTYWLTRFRLEATVRPSPMVGITVQGQDARVGDKHVGPTGAPFRDEFDLRLAHADIGSAKSPVTLRAGRQELVFGDQRLIGHLGWVNTPRSFDGARVMLRGPKLTVDGFALSVVTVANHAFNKSSFESSQFYGAYGSTTALVPKSTLEPFVFYRIGRNLLSEAGTIGDLRQVTLGARWVGALPAALDYNIEMAAQTGSLGPDDVRAWAGHWQMSRTLHARRALRALGEYNFASGDKNPADGTRGTFDQLYPTGHDKYGLSDQVGWRNLHHVRAGTEVLARKGFVVSGSYHSWWLADRHDALYNAGGVALARVPGGAASTHVGQEVDAQAVLSVSPQVQVAGGYAYVVPGAFLKQATPGGHYSAPYVMVTYVFLAER